jgi:hypothetical protein
MARARGGVRGRGSDGSVRGLVPPSGPWPADAPPIRGSWPVGDGWLVTAIGDARQDNGSDESAPADQHRDEEALSWVVASKPVYEEPVNTVLQSAALGSRSGRT